MNIHCEFCGKSFERSIHQYKEAIKNKWRQFCSPLCLAQSRTTKVHTNCQNPMCNKSFERTLSQTNISKMLFCSISCSASYYNAIRQNSTPLRKCKRAGCNNYVHTTDQKINYCGGTCSRLFRQGYTSYTPQTTISKIQSFAKENGRIPTRNELGYLNRLARRFFGTWNNAIEAAGYDPNPVMFAKHYVAKDGHKCDSMAEKIVDDWLYSHKIEHRVHVPYPWHNGMKCDFLAYDTWIEIFGLEGNLARYDALKKEKLELIKKYNLKTVRISLKEAYSPKKLETKLHSFIIC